MSITTTAPYNLAGEDVELIREALVADLDRQLKYAHEFVEAAVSSSSVTDLHDAESRIRDVARIMDLFTGPLGWPYTQYGRLVTLTRIERDVLWRLIASKTETFADPLVNINKTPADEAKQNRKRAELLFQLLDEIDWDENPTIRPGVLNGGTFGISRSSRVTRESLVEYLAEELAGQRAAFEHDSPYDESDPQTCELVAREREKLAALDAILQRLESGEIGAPRVHDTADDRASA